MFRKYEGMDTDEKDKYGRPVVVTAASFTRKAGINERTFLRWIDGEKDGRQRVGEVTGSNRTAEMGITIARGSTTVEQ